MKNNYYTNIVFISSKFELGKIYKKCKTKVFELDEKL